MISEPSNAFVELKKLSQQMKNLSLYILRNPLTVAESRTTSFIHWLRKPQQNKCAVKYFLQGLQMFLRGIHSHFKICLEICLWNPGTYIHKVVCLSSAKFGLVMNFLMNVRSTRYVKYKASIRTN